MAIAVVSGLPRSGTSMMMEMLQAGGVPILTDGIRGSDPSNPRGYFELERVRRLPAETTWLDAADGHAIKVIVQLLSALPATYQYRVVLMMRPMDEILASQRAMLKRLDRTGSVAPDELLGRVFQRQLEAAERWLADQPNCAMLPVSYHEVLQAPKSQAQRIADFLERRLAVAKMPAVVDMDLYRERQCASLFASPILS